ncbi:MAG: peptidoglycan DD-metalloendopeptidase family protein [Chitinispirillales bacterium]|jgi:murein DD-endopeptidase MepM/ murein hydrolase activator NlpD|nr:peptidoglycan DD-metalloendopeptidase family protein [Chitinispirillales bacterium]
MKFTVIYKILVIVVFSLSAASASVADIDFAQAFDHDYLNNIEDSTDEAQLLEEEAQDFSSLFDDLSDDDFMGIDTTYAWSNHRINSGRFDYRTLGPQDTIKIALVDSAQKRVYTHPFSNYVTSRFGQRRYLWHHGTDVKLNTGDTVRCAMDGIVRVIQFDRRGYGNVVVVRHHNGLETLYGHLYRVKVEVNQAIKSGDMVGLGGNTGRSTGAHLHFEFRYFGEPFNPEYIINFQSYTLKSDTLVLTRNNFEYLTAIRQTVYHTVRRGDTLGAIARRYGTTVNALCRMNGIRPRTTLSLGRRLVVRTGKHIERELTLQVTDQVMDAGQSTGGGGDSEQLILNSE